MPTDADLFASFPAPLRVSMRKLRACAIAVDVLGTTTRSSAKVMGRYNRQKERLRELCEKYEVSYVEAFRAVNDSTAF